MAAPAGDKAGGPRPMTMQHRDMRMAMRKAGRHMTVFAATMLPMAGALAIQLIAFAITARGLGVEAFGIYTGVLALAALGVECAGLGGADLLVRGTARDPSRFRAYFGNMLILAGLTFPAALVAGILIALGFMTTPLRLASVAALLGGEIAIGRSAASLELIMVAHRHTVRAGFVRLTTAGLRLALAALFFLLLGQSDLDLWIAAACVQSLATALTYLVLGAALYGRPAWTILSAEMGAGATFSLNQFTRAAQGNIDRVVLSRFADAASVGIYGAASRMLALGLFPLQVVTRMTYPAYFVHGQKGLRASRRYALRVSPVMLLVGLAASAVVALAGHWAPWVLGRDFAAMSGVVAWLGLALPLIALQYPAADALTGAGLQGARAIISLIAAVGFGLIMVVGTQLAGVNGLIIAFLVSHALFAIALWGAAFLMRDSSLRSGEAHHD